MNILVVDDSKTMRMIVKKTLREAGYDSHDVEEAEDGAAALEKIKDDRPGLILSDWNMPNMNGIELLEAINVEGINTRFGFVTTETTSEMRQRAKEAGAQFLISKPFTVESFRAALDPILG